MPNEPEDPFWTPRTAEQVAAAQGITAPQSLDELTGAAAELWESDEEFEQFLASIERSRGEPTSA